MGLKMTNLGIDFYRRDKYNFGKGILRQYLSDDFAKIATKQMRSITAMSDKEIKLIEMIRNNDDPNQAFITAMEIILGCLKLLEPSELKQVVDSLEHAEINQA